jgi:tetratricopeptide (TPR) repeat protein
MENRRLAVHRTIVVVDVEGFGDRRRTNPHQVAVRDGLYRALREAFGHAGIRWDSCGHEDRGDGVLILVPAEVPKGLLVESLPSALVAALRTHNGTHPGQERIRLRMALHAGEVNYDENGVTSAAVNLTFRLLDATALKAALASSSGVLALIASSWFFEEVVRHSAAAAAAAYRPAEVAVKETTAIGWICQPDHMDPVGTAVLERLLPVAAVPGGQPDVALRTLPRDTVTFTGRTQELDRLAAAVSETATAGGVIGVHAVDGMAGIGKTAFAVHAAHWLAASFPDGQIFLRLHAHTAGQRPVDPAEALATLLLTTGVAAQRIPPGLEARSALWRGHLADQKVLLVLDDAAGSEQVRPLLPGSAGCLVLVTSRRRLTALEEAVPISLGTLPPGEAAGLFVRLGGRPGLRPADRAVADVAGLCGYLPLAIRLAAARLCHHPAWTVADLAAELAAARDRLAAIQAEDVSVAAAFDLSYRDLTTCQRRLFRRLGLHPGTDIDPYAAAALDSTDLHPTQRRLGELYDHNLIGEPTRGRYRLHDLLREHARTHAAADDPAENLAAIDRLLDYYLHTAVAASRHIAWRIAIADPASPHHRPAWAPELRTEEAAIAWLRTERPNLHACVDLAAAHERHAHAIRIPAAISDFLHSQGHWNEAVTLAQAALTAARMTADRASQAGALCNLGMAQCHAGDYPSATTSQTQALDLFRDLGDHRGQAWAHNQLGIVQRLTGDYSAATTSQTQALRLFRDLGDHRGQAWALNNLGTLQLLTGDYPSATTSQTHALQLYRDLGDRQGQAWALNNLGAIQQCTEDYPAATASQTQALQLFRNLGDRHGEAWALNQLGIVERLTKAYTAATASLTQALQLFRDLGDRHGQADASINLGELLSLSSAHPNSAHTNSAHPDARSYHTQALSVAREVNAAYQEARALEGIGRCQIEEGNPGQGVAQLRQALAIYRRIGAPEAQRVETALLNQR